MPNQFVARNGIIAQNNTEITGSLIVTNGITGSLFGTASYASFALTASYVIGGGGGGGTIAIQDEGASQGSAGTLNFVGSGVTAAVGGGVATITVTGGGGSLDQGFNFIQAIPAVTWSVVHSLDTRTPLVNVYSSSYSQLIPSDIVTIDSSSLEIRFSSPQQGFAIISKGSGLSTTVSSSNAILYQTASAATTWSFDHYLGVQYPVFTIFDQENAVIIPQKILALNTASAAIYFSVPTRGIAVASKGGSQTSTVVSAVNAITASFALNGNASAILYQTSSAQTTWSFDHFLGTQFPVFTIYDVNNNVIVPQRINAVNTSSAAIYFSSPTLGTAVASKGGYTGALISFATNANTAISASFATTAISSSYADNVIPIFSKTFLISNNTIIQTTDTGSFPSWRAPYPCTASLVLAFTTSSFGLSSGSLVNANKNGLRLLANSLVTTGSVFVSSSVLQNQNFNRGDILGFDFLTLTGSLTELSIQVDFTK
jgi:hypothetical protein